MNLHRIPEGTLFHVLRKTTHGLDLLEGNTFRMGRNSITRSYTQYYSVDYEHDGSHLGGLSIRGSAIVKLIDSGRDLP